MRTSLNVTWPCRCGGVSAPADPQLVTLISGGGPPDGPLSCFMGGGKEGRKEREEGGRGQGRQDSDAFLKVCGPSQNTHKHIRRPLGRKQKPPWSWEARRSTHNKQLLMWELIRRSLHTPFFKDWSTAVCREATGGHGGHTVIITVRRRKITQVKD